MMTRLGRTPHMSSELQPPFIANFFLGLPRRVEELIDSFRHGDGELTEHEQSAVAKLLQTITDELDAVLTEAMALGYPPVTEIEAKTEVADPDIDTAGLEAASLQLGQQIAGTPISAWARHPDELEQLRLTVEQISEVLRVKTQERNVRDEAARNARR